MGWCDGQGREQKDWRRVNKNRGAEAQDGLEVRTGLKRFGHRRSRGEDVMKTDEGKRRINV